MRTLIACCIAVLFGNFILAQTTFKTSEGVISFNASTPLEDINAINKEVNAIVNTDNGEFASVLLMTDFHFRRALMQEHFNENYVESERYPKAYFTGFIKEFAAEKLTVNAREFIIEGQLTIHGVTRTFRTTAAIRKQAGKITMQSEFIVKPEDYDIKVPKLLFKKIAQEISVEVAFDLISI